MRTFKSLTRAENALQYGDRIIRIRLPADQVFVIIPAHATKEAKLDRLGPGGRCDGPEIII